MSIHKYIIQPIEDNSACLITQSDRETTVIDYRYICMYVYVCIQYSVVHACMYVCMLCSEVQCCACMYIYIHTFIYYIIIMVTTTSYFHPIQVTCS